MRILPTAFLLALTALPLGAQARTARPASLGLQANITFLYYRDIPRAQRFYEDVLGLTLTVDQGYSKIFRVSQSSYVGLVDESQGLHRAAEQKPVTLSFVTAEVDAWYTYLRGRGVEIVHELADGRRQPTRGFVAKDPEGYYLEFETFRDDPQNARIRPQLADSPGGSQRDAMLYVDGFLKRYLGQFDASVEHPKGWNPLTALRGDLSPALMRALQEDRDASAANDEEIVGLDFDPFINAQDVCEGMEARAAVQRDTTMDVAVYDTCDWGHPLVPDVIYVLQRSGPRWIVVDIRYAGGQSLLEVLAYYAEQRKQP
jgi:predicted enzyme related to lactoylglutathione lyase